MLSLEFYKMSASGNDFIIIDNRDGEVYDNFKDLKEFIVKVCRRNHSVGSDGFILIEKSKNMIFAGDFSMLTAQRRRCAEMEDDARLDLHL